MDDGPVGLIGLGRMGAAIGGCLLRRGHLLGVVGHASPGPVATLVRAGAREFPDPTALAGWATTVLLCLPSSTEVETVGAALLAAARPAVTAVADCSTSRPDSTQALAGRFAARGIMFVDAPLTRTPVEAAQGRLNCVLGGGEPAHRRLAGVLDAFCENVVPVDGIGRAHRLKLANNALSLGMAALAAETLNAAAAAGLDLDRLRAVVSLGGANSGPFQGLCAAALEGDQEALAFSLAHACKDLGYYLETIGGDHTPLAAQARAALHRAAERAGADATLPALLTRPPDS